MLEPMKPRIVSKRWRRVAIMAIGSSLLILQLAWGQSPAELMEKAIFTEETKGDLEGARLLYEQALKESENAAGYAGQALYRLGLLHLRKNDTDKGWGYLRALIDRYPNQTNLVAAARARLPEILDLLPPPWKEGEQMIIHFRFPTGVQVGMTAYHATSGKFEDRPVWMVGGRTFAGVNGRSVVYAEAESFRPIRSEWMHGVIGEAIGEYSEKFVRVTNLTSGSTKMVELSRPAFDNEQVIHLMRRLPLEIGFKKTIDVLTTLGGGMILPITLEVRAKEELTVPAGKFQAYKVDLSVNQTFWYSADEHRYLVRMEAGGVIGELAEVRHSAPGQFTVFTHDQLGFSMAAPHGWFFYNGGAGGEKDRTRIAILDPEAAAHSSLFAYPLETVPAELRSSLRAWAEERMREASEESRDFKVREDSWTVLKLGGYPAISCVADYIDNRDGKPRVNYAVYSFAGKTAAIFFFSTQPAKFDEFRGKFGSITGSFVAK